MEWPQDFTTTIRQRLGQQFPDFIRSLDQPAPVSIRLNPGKTGPFENATRVPWSQWGRYLNERPQFTLDPCFHAGAYYVQEASSMFLEQVFIQHVDRQNSLHVLDLSAAPGGKSTHMVSLISRNSLLVSNEVIRSRASILAENVTKWGHDNVLVTNNDPADFQSLRRFFDVVLIDAPCSGEGLFRKDPSAAKEWSTHHVTLCANRQRRILSDVWPALKENGIVVYCTCTFNEEENEGNLMWLQQQHAVEFLKLSVDPEWNIEECEVGNTIAYRFFPHRVKGEGFFLSVMRKKAYSPAPSTRTKKKLSAPGANVTDRIRKWLKRPEEKNFYQHNDQVFFLPSRIADAADQTLQHLKIVTAGTAAASVKHDKLIPSQALAMSLDLDPQSFPAVEFSYDDAIRYLRRDNLPATGGTKGFTLATYSKTPLGWLNVLPGRVNNLYPSEWRIRMAAEKRSP